MAYGLPVVVAGHGGLVEIVSDGETGFLFQPNDAHSFAEALRKLLSDGGLRAKMGAEGRSRQASLFSLTAYRENLLAALFPGENDARNQA